MREDLHKVVTERPRYGHASKSLKTHRSIRELHFEPDSDKYAMPKRGKMLMNSREHGPWMESKEFSDLINPLKRWLFKQVGRRWDKVYSELTENIPRGNKVNDHLYGHIFTYVQLKVEMRVVKTTSRGKQILRPFRAAYGYARKLDDRDLYVHPQTGILCRGKKDKHEPKPM